MKKEIVLFEESGHQYPQLPSPYVIRGSYKAIVDCLPRKVLDLLIGGYVLWGPSEEPDLRMPGGAIGVYGNREVSKFKAALRSRGVNFDVVSNSGPKQSVTLVYLRSKMSRRYFNLGWEVLKQRFRY